ncbi:NAD(P)/FAD-dependent oxidoreductase [Nakamurella antarctica]|uniref:NAD(P)/FAD-dependent oxidoreductase n=1 Tax=Nakamurella antarctica TaxID=1902245 RepID=A0A3G8ZPG0_9ACTN|nr:NAD(P)/FAD-dependent oxidoreductase [Nakamurella antarctica]AZI59140.1 NAD(P)/FAD-dependent oxidoreductase [Nakamurella antarctica]
MFDATCDLIVIGAGAVGENIADRAHRGGLSVVIVESELVGGECSYWACMPSKALITSVMALDAAKNLAGSREAVTGELDVTAVFTRRDSFTSNWDDKGQVDWLQGAGIELIRGYGRISGVREVTVTGPDGEVTLLTARHAVAVSNGTTATVPDIPGLRDAKPWTSREATSSSTVPASLVIIGGGVVASEMATAYSAFGSHVTMLVRSELLGGMEPFAGEMVAAALRAAGVTILTAAATRVDRTDDGLIIELSTGETLTAAELLVATGRTPATGDIGLDVIGLEPGRYLHVDDTMRVEGVEGGWLYAVGDANGRVLLTHQGKYQARACGDVIAARALGHEVHDAPWGKHVATADIASVPSVVFTQPEVASVGLTAEQAEAQHPGKVKVVDYEIGNVSGAALRADGYQGKARMVVNTESEVLLGVTFVGPEVGEMIHAATIAVVGQVPLNRLWHAVPAYPTMNEVWLRLLETYGL